MKIQEQCCTLEQAKRLKELGVAQKAIFAWFDDMNTCGTPVFSNASQYHCPTCCNEAPAEYEEFSAFTVAELSMILPQYYPSWRFNEEGEEFWIATVIGECKDKSGHIEKDHYDIRTAPAFDRFGKTQAEALATLLIALLDTGAITIDDVNSRL